MFYTITRYLSLAAALSTLALMIYAARLRADNAFSPGLLGYAWLLRMAVWATLPYLVLISSHPETMMRTVKVSGSATRYFLQGQGNQGLVRRRTFIRRTSKPADLTQKLRKTAV